MSHAGIPSSLLKTMPNTRPRGGHFWNSSWAQYQPSSTWSPGQGLRRTQTTWLLSWSGEPSLDKISQEKEEMQTRAVIATGGLSQEVLQEARVTTTLVAEFSWGLRSSFLTIRTVQMVQDWKVDSGVACSTTGESGRITCRTTDQATDWMLMSIDRKRQRRGCWECPTTHRLVNCCFPLSITYRDAETNQQQNRTSPQALGRKAHSLRRWKKQHYGYRCLWNMN